MPCNEGGVVSYVDEYGFPQLISSNTMSPGYDDQGLNISRDFPSILFCLKSDFPKDPKSGENNDTILLKLLQNKEKASLKFGDHSWGPKSSRWGKITGLNDLVFNNREELYEYMKQFKGLDIPKVPEVNMTN